MNGRQFALDVRQWAERQKMRADEAVGNIVFRVAAEIDRRSPVGDASYWKSPPPKGYVGGHFRGNWQLGVGVIPAGEVPGADPDGRQTLGRVMAAIPEQAGGKVYYLANNAPYARRLETGWSRQAPAGVVGLTVAMFEQIVREELAAVPK